MKTTEYSKAMMKDELPEFFRQVEARLHKGAEIYGDVSFYEEPRKLIAEIEEELLDVLGWGFPLWCRIQRIKMMLGLLEKGHRPSPPTLAPQSSQQSSSQAAD